MNIASIRGFAFHGIEGRPLEVSAKASPGPPSFTITGLSDRSRAGASERVRTTLAAMGLSLPSKRVTVDLSPADPVADGSHHDLPVALALLGAMGVLSIEDLSGYAALGGLAPDGSLLAVPGVLSAAIGASALEVGLICPEAQGGEAAWAGSIEVLAAPDLLAIINHFRGTQVLAPPCAPGARIEPPSPHLADVPVADGAKRALEGVAHDDHPLALTGPRDACATLAACLPGLLPHLDVLQSLETSMVHSLAGLLDGGRLIRRPPYRVVTAVTPMTALLGGGRDARPGEVSLAHNGVLFLDGTDCLDREASDGLCRVMEAGRAGVARGAARVDYPARFRLVVAVNPDPGRAGGDAAGGVLDDGVRRMLGGLGNRIGSVINVSPIARP